MSQGRTATVERVVRNGRTCYRKQNPTAELADIEFRIYEALWNLQDLGFVLPRVQRDSDPRVLYVEDAGTTFSDLMNSPAYERLVDLDVLYKTIQARSRVNAVVDTILTERDKAYLTQMQQEKLLQTARKRQPSVSEKDVAEHYWAYRMMNALGISDDKFKETYTATIGAKIDTLLPQFGKWCTDNYTRNNVVTADGKVIPFDFNSIRYGLSQMDTAPIAAHYILGSSLTRVAHQETQRDIISKLAELEGYADDSKYTTSFLVSSIHANGLIAGYRTQECRKRRDTIVSAYNAGLRSQAEVQSLLDEYLAFALAFEDIDHYQTAAVRPLTCHGAALSFPSQEEEKLLYLSDTLTRVTFGQRILIKMSIPYNVQTAGDSYARNMVANMQ